MSRLLTFGDLHCDRSHLRGLIERAVEERCDALVSLGDLCYLPREPEGRRFLRSAGAAGVGNDQAIPPDWNVGQAHSRTCN